MQKQWNIKIPNPSLQKILSEGLNLHPIIAQLLINRDIDEVNKAKSFLSSNLSDLHDPFILKDMDKAIERIRQAKEKREKVLIFGDYDADGITSSVLLYKILDGMGISLINHIPHRIEDGYGFNHDIADFALSEGISLIITVDCGITAVEEVETFNRIGIDIIIIDHHEAGEKLPNAIAVIDPKRKDCPYPFKELAAVGLVAKLAQALENNIPDGVLEFVAIGTVADVVPLIGENRIFVKNGLSKISNTKNKGLTALLETSKIKGKKLKPFHIGFILGPRINAAGRMDSAHESLDLFLSKDDKTAYILALNLEKYNYQRQKMQSNIVQEAFEIVEQEINFKEHNVIVVSKEGWHKGVLGIVASRIVEKYYRPTIVISLENGIGTASARSIEGFHLYDALSNCNHCLERFGGHEGAAGLTIKKNNIGTFRELINCIAKEKLQIENLTPSISIESEISFSCINLELAEIISMMEPFGEGNPTPIFCSRNLTVKSNPVIMAKDTIKFWLTDWNTSLSAVGFGMAKYKDLIEIGKKIDIAYEIGIDDWNKAPAVQLKLKDIRLNDRS